MRGCLDDPTPRKAKLLIRFRRPFRLEEITPLTPSVGAFLNSLSLILISWFVFLERTITVELFHLVNTESNPLGFSHEGIS
ncbi:hypothetical protein PsorP6_006871 [Peronosclerospora sorghi]|uniref:Uncharacterized protein n=1 Tax=Peronosclerospora sorghi TaxID=230839 RepID=A0ACC0WCS7_9STRA|nr:hypothetical protein PsorP6_006871 [Peronosclerospora sorghi]